jgi:hypothetical protein
MEPIHTSRQTRTRQIKSTRSHVVREHNNQVINIYNNNNNNNNNNNYYYYYFNKRCSVSHRGLVIYIKKYIYLNAKEELL